MFRVQGSGFRVQGSGFRVQDAGFRVQGSGFGVRGSGCRVQGSGFRVQGSGFRGSSSPFVRSLPPELGRVHSRVGRWGGLRRVGIISYEKRIKLKLFWQWSLPHELLVKNVLWFDLILFPHTISLPYGDATPCRMDGEHVQIPVSHYGGRDCTRSLRSSYTGLYRCRANSAHARQSRPESRHG